MEEKYSRTQGERTLEIMKMISSFKVDDKIENPLDRYEKMMTETKKVDLVRNLEYALLVQFLDRLEKNGSLRLREE